MTTVVQSRSNGKLLSAARSFASRFPELLAIVPGRLAGELLQIGEGAAGLHRTTLIQLASSLARPAMAQRGLVPLSGLGLEAVAARVAHQARKDRELKY